MSEEDIDWLYIYDEESIIQLAVDLKDRGVDRKLLR
jgi:hypothetical protein